MSQNNNDKTNVIAVAPEADNETPVVEKQSFFQRKIVTPIKKHPKLTLAVGGGLALVGLAAFAGRATAPETTEAPESTTEEDLALMKELVAESEDTTVA